MDADQHEIDDWRAVDAVLAADPSRVALRGADGATLTRAALCERIATIRESLASLGLGPSHGVATVLPTGIETAVALLALMGRVNLMPLNPGATPTQWADQMAAGGVDAVIVPKGATPALPDHVPLYRLADRLVGPKAPAPQQIRAAGLVLQTSGSTGTPKRVPLSTGQLVASARNIALHLSLGPDDVAIHALPMFHVGAVVDLLAAPLLAGGSVIVARDLSAEALREAMAMGGTWLQLVPTALGHLLEGDAPDHDLRFVRMVSADLSADLQARAEVALGVPIIQMYGMTETAGQIASNPLPPGQAKQLSVGVPAGPEVAIIDAHGASLPTGKDGEVCVRGSTVMEGYEGSDATPRFGQWLRTGDLGHLDGDGYLFLTGRVKELINRGGEKISPLTVERAAKAVLGVQDAVAYALPHQTLGEHVGLTVVADEDVTEEAVLGALSGNLADHEQPRRVQFVSTLPKLPSGKVDRRGVALAGREETPASDERTGVARIASKRWAEVLSVRPPHDDADFFDDGGDSLSATDFLIALETDLGRPVSPNLLFDAPRFGALVAQLERVPQVEDDAAEAPEWMPFLRRRIAGWMGQRVGPSGLLVARNTVQDGTKIFYADHSDRNQAALGRAAGTGHPVYMVSTMRGYGEDHHAFFPELAAFYAGEITAILAPGEPIILSGYCGGGLLMTHIAPLLIAAGHPIDVFVAFDVPFEAPTP